MSATVETTPQHQLSAVTGVSQEVARARLLRVTWAAPRDEEGNLIGPPGLHDLKGTQRTMIVNDLTRHAIKAQIRIASLETLRAVTGDDTATSIAVKGPTEASYVPGDTPWVDYAITDQWQEYPAIFASWLDYAISHNKRLGAGHVENRLVDDVASGQVVKRWQQYHVRPQRLFEFRLPGDQGGAAAVVVPGQRATQDTEVANLRAELAEMRRMLAGLTGIQPVASTAPLTSTATGGGDVKFEMEGGAFLTVDERRQVGYDPAEAYDADEGTLASELAKVEQQIGGGAVKGRSRR